MFGYYLTPAKVLELLKQVDGSGSNLDADSLQGNTPTDFATSAHGHNNATTTEPGFQSSSDKSKLDSIQPGAEVNSVISVAGKTDAVTLVKADVGLSNVQNIDQTNASNLATGTVPSARIPTLNQNTTGNAATANKWTTPRNLTIGNTAKAIDGSGNVSWSLAEINPNIPLTNVNNTYGATQTISRTAFAGIQLETTSAPLDQKIWLIALGNSTANSFSIQERTDSGAYITSRFAINRGVGNGALIDSNPIWHSGNLIVEPGGFTPSLDGTGWVYANRGGAYKRENDTVKITFWATPSSIGSSTNLDFIGLPFVASFSSAFLIRGIQLNGISNLAYVVGYSSGNKVILELYTSNGQSRRLTPSDVTANSLIRVSGTLFL